MPGTETISWFYSSPNGFYRSVTLDQPASDLTDFPVLFSGTYTYLKSVANGGRINDANGYDMVWYSDSALTTKLNFERVYWDATTGTVEFWVKVPTLTSASALVIYLAYGNSLITTDQQNATGTWDTNYKGVWHLPDGTTLTANDSTSTGANGTLVNTPTAGVGKIDGGADFASASSEYITMGNVIDFTNNNFTFEFWYKSSSGATGYFLNKRVVPPDNTGCYVIYFNGSGRIALYIQTDNSNWKQITGTNNTADGQWHHFMCVRSGTSNPTLTIYIDGASDAGTPQQGGTVTTLTNLGDLKFSSLTQLYNGSLDEVRISNILRSATYNATTYSNQNNPANFYAIGSETPV